MTPTFFALLVIAGGMFAPGTGVLYLLMVFCLFGAAAAIALPALGGATITPAVLFLPFVLVRAMHERGMNGCLRQIAFPTAGFWLLLLVLWGVLSAYFLPRIFTGEVMIRTADRFATELGTSLVPLHPVSTNITQSGYALGGVCAFVAVRALLAGTHRLDHFRDAVLLLASLNCLAGLVSLGEFYLGLPSMLEYVRTGGYVIFETYEEAGLMRIAGTFSETSTFSAFTLPLFAFTLSLWFNDVRPRYSGAVALTSLALLLMSTSTTAYGGLAIYLSSLGLALTWRGLVHGKLPRLGTLFLFGWLGLAVLGYVFLFEPDVARRVARFFEVTLFNKLQSASGIERSSWNQQAWSNFVDTYGVGVGLGSVRTSSFPLVLLSNVGILGTLFFLAFLARVFRGDLPGTVSPATALQSAARQAVLAALIGASISGAVFDLGMAFYAFAAAATMRSRAEPSVERMVLGDAHGYA